MQEKDPRRNLSLCCLKLQTNLRVRLRCVCVCVRPVNTHTEFCTSFEVPAPLNDPYWANISCML